MSDTYNSSLKAKIRQLTKGKHPASGLFVPQIFNMAAQLEAVTFEQFSHNPTLSSRGLLDLRNALNFGVITAVFSSGMEAEALGAELNGSVYPPEIVQRPLSQGNGLLSEELAEQMLCSGRVAAAIENVKRIRAVSGKDTVLAASLTGTARLAKQLVGPSIGQRDRASNSALLEFCGYCQTQLVRSLAEAGVQVFIVNESEIDYAVGDLRDSWLASLRPIINVANFHRSLVAIAPVVSDVLVIRELLKENLSGAIWCPPVAVAESAEIQTVGVSISNKPSDWSAVSCEYGLVITCDEVAPEIQIPELKAALDQHMASNL